MVLKVWGRCLGNSDSGQTPQKLHSLGYENVPEQIARKRRKTLQQQTRIVCSHMFRECSILAEQPEIPFRKLQPPFIHQTTARQHLEPRHRHCTTIYSSEALGWRPFTSLLSIHLVCSFHKIDPPGPSATYSLLEAPGPRALGVCALGVFPRPRREPAMTGPRRRATQWR